MDEFDDSDEEAWPEPEEKDLEGSCGFDPLSTSDSLSDTLDLSPWLTDEDEE